jgi:translation initiation factor eIF-2B subunit epsilon
MAPKTSKKTGGSNIQDLKTEQPLQAILMADSFANAFRPLSFDKPKALLPLINVPMIEYTLEFLACNDVEEV